MSSWQSRNYPKAEHETVNHSPLPTYVKPTLSRRCYSTTSQFQCCSQLSTSLSKHSQQPLPIHPGNLHNAERLQRNMPKAEQDKWESVCVQLANPKLRCRKVKKTTRAFPPSHTLQRNAFSLWLQPQQRLSVFTKTLLVSHPNSPTACKPIRQAKWNTLNVQLAKPKLPKGRT